MTYFIVYKTTNRLNDRYYIGAHRCSSLDDGYLGSGRILRRAIKKYGKENFEREIVHVCVSDEEMFILEKTEIGDRWKSDPLCYNSMPGGSGGFDHINSAGINCGANNCMLRPEIREKVSRAVSITRKKNPDRYAHISRANAIRGADKTRGRKRPKHSAWMKQNMSSRMTTETRRKISESKCHRFLVYSPTGIEYNVDNLVSFCLEHDLVYQSMYMSSRSGSAIKKGKSRGWRCIKILAL